MESIALNLSQVRQRIRTGCLGCGRDPASVGLIAVSKTVAPERVRAAVEAGIRMLGENYIQEARDKIEALPDLDVTWHFIGHLQSNKAKFAAACFSWVHTVDSLKLAAELNKRALKLERRLNVLLQVHLGDEASKEGVEPTALAALHRALAPLEALRVRGLMAIPPYAEDPEATRPHFRRLRLLLEDLRDQAPSPEALTELSIGMSHDFEVAIEEGATLVRVGTAIFGRRPKTP